MASFHSALTPSVVYRNSVFSDSSCEIGSSYLAPLNSYRERKFGAGNTRIELLSISSARVARRVVPWDRSVGKVMAVADHAGEHLVVAEEEEVARIDEDEIREGRFSSHVEIEERIINLDNSGLSYSGLDVEVKLDSASNTSEDSGEEEQDFVSPQLISREVARRRNFAIISHPDAGKTTLTEKLLLYGGAIHEAGAVKARRAARHATSDWMELEKQRGISITSTALGFETKGFYINLLDTPGHQDFGEDTFRTLAAADNAVILVDGGKGLEPQTRKLFEVIWTKRIYFPKFCLDKICHLASPCIDKCEVILAAAYHRNELGVLWVCRMRKLPCFTFMNKMDRPALEPLELIDQLEREFGLATYPVNWPIGSGDRFLGVFHRPRNEVHIFDKGVKHGTVMTGTQVIPWGDPCLKQIIPNELFDQLQEEIALLEELSPPLDMEKIHSGALSPVFFGSAMNNFGVELFLETFLDYAMKPGTHVSDLGDVQPEYQHFTGFVFKLQANMDPKHRDKVAFLRVCSGQFNKGMKVQLARNGKTITLTRPQKMFGQDRSTVDVGYAGDVIGLNNPNVFCIGDTLYCGPRRLYPGIPSFSPELFCYMRNPNPSKYKQFLKGVTELLGEGAVQVLYSINPGRTDPILAAVGQLQFEYRMTAEYNVETQLEPLGYSVARWVTGGWPVLEKVGKLYNCATVKDQWGRPVLLFNNEWNVSQLLNDKPEIGKLMPYALPPQEETRK